MIIQACLNGARAPAYHPALPLTPAALARDGAACVAAGAAELHVHARGADGCESLAAVDETVRALRQACPGTLIGVSTGAWIENDPARTRAAIAGWQAVPDHASVNLAEADAPAVIEALVRRGVMIEAGLASVADAGRLLSLAQAPPVLRVLIEIEQQSWSDAMAEVDAIAGVLQQGGLHRPILLHGIEALMWPLIEAARTRRWSTRVGLEDGCRLPDGALAPDNATLVAAAVARFYPRQTGS